MYTFLSRILTIFQFEYYIKNYVYGRLSSIAKVL